MSDKFIFHQLVKSGISDSTVIEAIFKVPRSKFFKYDDPSMLSTLVLTAHVCQLFSLTGQEKVLDLDPGTGFQAAVLSLLAGQVYIYVKDSQTAAAVRRRLYRLKYYNVRVLQKNDDLYNPGDSLYDAITSDTMFQQIPLSCRLQLKDGGSIVIVENSKDTHQLTRLIKSHNEYLIN
ncbi:MAG TPA: hypothetical protein VF828_04360 [Patescibacteria group bacterium]